MALGKVGGNQLETTLNIDSGTLYVDGTNNRVGVGTVSPNQALHAIGEGLFEKASADSVVSINSTGGSGRSYQIRSQTSGEFYVYDNTAGASRLTVDSSGRVTMPYQPFARASYSGGNLAATNIVPLNTHSLTRGGMTIASDRITVPVTGAYMVGFHHLANTGGVQIRVLKNGSAVRGSYTQEVTGANGNFSAQQIIECSANDYLEFQTFSGGSVHGNGDYNCMWAFLLG